MNLLCLALTARLGRSLPEVLDQRVMRPVGASSSWSWYGYDGAEEIVGDRVVPVVSGGAHWGGGLWMSAADLARVGELYRCGGAVGGRGLVSQAWVDRSWTATRPNPDDGLLWWLNDRAGVFPSAPRSGRPRRPRQPRAPPALGGPGPVSRRRLALGRQRRAPPASGLDGGATPPLSVNAGPGDARAPYGRSTWES